MNILGSLNLLRFLLIYHLLQFSDGTASFKNFEKEPDEIHEDFSLRQEEKIFTIFSSLKPNKTSEIYIRQKNAVKSWSNLKPRPNIILFGDEQGTKGLSEEIGNILYLIHKKKIKLNNF